MLLPLLLLIAFVQTVVSFQTSISINNRPYKASQTRTADTFDFKKRASRISPSMVSTDLAPPLERSELRQMIDDAAVTLMKRFWEIDLQTQRRMDMILSLYEVRSQIQQEVIIIANSKTVICE